MTSALFTLALHAWHFLMGVGHTQRQPHGSLQRWTDLSTCCVANVVLAYASHSMWARWSLLLYCIFCQG